MPRRINIEMHDQLVAQWRALIVINERLISHGFRDAATKLHKLCGELDTIAEEVGLTKGTR